MTTTWHYDLGIVVDDRGVPLPNQTGLFRLPDPADGGPGVAVDVVDTDGAAAVIKTSAFGAFSRFNYTSADDNVGHIGYLDFGGVVQPVASIEVLNSRPAAQQAAAAAAAAQAAAEAAAQAAADALAAVQAGGGGGGGGGGINPIGTASARKVPYVDDSAIVRWTAATAVVARALGWTVVNDFSTTPGTPANLTQARAAAATLTDNGTLYFEGSYAWSGQELVLTRPGVNVTGPNSVIDGTITFGDGQARIELGGSIHHMNFKHALDKTAYPVKGYADGSAFIIFDRVRDLVISGVSFYGAAYPIMKRANASSASHDNSMIRVVGACRFDECDVAFYAPNASGESWQSLADSDFVGNLINKAYVSMYYAFGQDGGHVSGNTLFQINYGSTNSRKDEKREGIRVDFVDWLHVEDNQIFETGHEGLLLDHVRRAVISRNLFAWCGQRVISDAVKITSNSGGTYGTQEYASVVFSENDGTYYSKSLFSAIGDFASLVLGPNTCLYSGTADRFYGTAGQFTGTSQQIIDARRAALAAVSHYRYDTSAVTGLTASQVQVIGGALNKADHYDKLTSHTYTTAIQSLGPYAGIGGAYVPALVFAQNTSQSVCNVRGLAEASSTFSGRVTVVVRNQAGNKETVYELLLSKTKETTNNLKVIELSGGGLGYTDGAAADDPSFTWDLSSGTLVAKPVNLTGSASTAGGTLTAAQVAALNTFAFALTFSGNLLIG